MKQLVISTVGASLLLNQLTPEEKTQRDQLTKNANISESLASTDLLTVLDNLSNRAMSTLKQDNVSINRRASAELNGIYALYNNQLHLGANDFHYLIGTDTAQGKKTAHLVRDYLTYKGINSDVFIPKTLSSSNTKEFGDGIKALIAWCDEYLPSYHQNGYRIIFNLSGGFKTLQGYLNTIGMFYADEIIYIFESATDLVRIPRLPIAIDNSQLSKYAIQLAMLAAEEDFLPKNLIIDSGITDTFLEEVDDRVILSTWGKLVWQKSRQNLLSEELLDFPHLIPTPDFRQEFKKASKEERIQLQEALAKVAVIFHLSGGNTATLKKHTGLLYENYDNKSTSDGLPIGHFRLNKGRRVSCVSAGGMLQLRHFGAHDYVNHNP